MSGKSKVRVLLGPQINECGGGQVIITFLLASSTKRKVEQASGKKASFMLNKKKHPLILFKGGPLESYKKGMRAHCGGLGGS